MKYSRVFRDVQPLRNLTMLLHDFDTVQPEKVSRILFIKSINLLCILLVIIFLTKCAKRSYRDMAKKKSVKFKIGTVFAYSIGVLNIACIH